MNFKAAKELILTKLYEKIYTSDENEYFFVSELRELCDNQFSSIFAKKVVNELLKEGGIESMLFEDDGDTGYTITAKGIGAAEKILARGVDVPADLVAIPASDRLVQIDHNQPEAANAIEAVEDATEAIRQSNQIEDPERQWMYSHLSSGVKLLKDGRAIAMSAIRSLIFGPLGAAFRASSEDQLRTVITKALEMLRVWLGY